MFTKKDIALLIVAMKEVFATKDDLIRFATKDDLNTLEKKFEEKVSVFKDAILKELKDMRDEVAIVGGQRDMLEDYDQRIETIEKHLHILPTP